MKSGDSPGHRRDDKASAPPTDAPTGARWFPVNRFWGSLVPILPSLCGKPVRARRTNFGRIIRRACESLKNTLL